MRIGQVVHIYHPHTGGIENYVYRLKCFLQSQGHKVTVYTTDLSLVDDGAKAKDAIYCKTTFSLIRNPISIDLKQKLADSDDDIYHLHSPWFLPSLIAAKVLKGKPKVMTVHSAQIENKNLMISALNISYHPFAQYILGSMDMLMPQGELERQRLLKRFRLRPDRLVPIPNGIEVGRFQRNDEAIASFTHKHKLCPDSFKILCVSRLIPEKNPDKLIQAVSRYLKRENIEVILVGGGSTQYIEHLKVISDHRVHILGKVSQEELVAAYYSADLFVFLGLWEGMPTVILEAMACGLPILTTPVAGIPDMVTEGENGLFVNVPINEREIAERVTQFIQDTTIARRMGETNRIKIREQYTWESVGAKILNIYEQVLGRRCNGS